MKTNDEYANNILQCNYDDLFGLVRQPLSVHIELTYKCNLKCKHCYVDQSLENKEYTVQKWKDACDIFINKGIFLFVLSGGEPLLAPYFLDLYSYLWNRGAKIILFSNLLLLSEAHLKEFSVHPPIRIETSIYGSSPDTHEFITREKGSFARLIENVKRLQTLGISITLKTPVMRNNYHEIDKIEDYVKNELNCDFRYGCDIEYNGNNLDLILSKDEYLEFINNKKNLLEHMKNLYNDCINVSHNNCKEFQCKAGIICIACDPFGNIKTCISDKALFNVKESNSWDKLITNRINLEITKDNKCYSCKLKALCEYCPAKKEFDKELSCIKAYALAALLCNNIEENEN